MSSSITVDVGGTSASGAMVYLLNTSGSNVPTIGAANASGVAVFNNLVAGTYRLSGVGNFGSGAYKGFTYKSTLDFIVDGTTTYTGVVLPAPTAP